jgi:hypothetical protein
MGFIVEMMTVTGKVCESFATYEEARRRVDSFPAESLAGIPFIFQELPDGSQRLVRDDRKPIQWHRLPDDRPPGPDEPISLAEPLPGLSAAEKTVLRTSHDPDPFPGEDEGPLPLCGTEPDKD